MFVLLLQKNTDFFQDYRSNFITKKSFLTWYFLQKPLPIERERKVFSYGSFLYLRSCGFVFCWNLQYISSGLVLGFRFISLGLNYLRLRWSETLKIYVSADLDLIMMNFPASSYFMSRFMTKSTNYIQFFLFAALWNAASWEVKNKTTASYSETPCCES